MGRGQGCVGEGEGTVCVVCALCCQSGGRLKREAMEDESRLSGRVGAMEALFQKCGSVPKLRQSGASEDF